MRRFGRFFSLCLLTASLVIPCSSSSAAGQDTSIRLVVETPHYILDEQGLRVPGYSLSDTPGAPQLPVWTTVVEAPGDVDWSVAEAASESRILYVDAPLPSAPVTELRLTGPGDVLDPETTADAISVVSRPDPAIYGSDALYPSQAVQAGPKGIARGKHLLPLKVYPFQYNPATGAILYRPRIEVIVSFSPRRAVETAAGFAATASGGAASEPGVRILTTERGLYSVSYEALTAAGAPVAGLDPAQLAMWSVGQPIDIEVTGATDGTFDPGDAVVFYAEPYVGRYMTHNVYRLTWSAGPGGRIAARSAAPALTQAPRTTIRKSARVEYDRQYMSTFSDLARDADHFFDDTLYPNAGAATKTTTYTLTLPNPVPAGAAELRVRVHGGRSLDDRNPDQSLALRLNGAALGQYQWDGSVIHTITETVPASGLVPGANSLALEASLSQLPGIDYYFVYPDWAELIYPARAEATDNRLYIEEVIDLDEPETPTPTPTLTPTPTPTSTLTSTLTPTPTLTSTPTSTTPAPRAIYLPLITKDTTAITASAPVVATSWLAAGGDVSAGGFTAPGIRVYDVSDALHPVLLSEVKETSSGGSYSVTFAGQEAARFYLVADGGLRQPAGIQFDAASSLQSPANSADYIAIVHRSLWDAVQPLLDHRTAEGFRVAKVDVQDIYDEFSGGRVDPEALRAFLTYAYHNWNSDGEHPQQRPQYVLLVGDGHFDFKGALRPDLPNLIPPYLLDIDPFIGETAADNRFVSTDGEADFLPDMAIGRLPAKTPADVTAVVDKVLAYEKTAAAGDWQKRVVFVADDKDDPAGNFHQLSDLTRTTLPSPYESQTIYYKSSAALDTPAEMKTAIKSAFDEGAIYLQWFGHASRTFWGKDKIWELADPAKLAQNTSWPFTAHYSCWSGYFIDVKKTGSEQVLTEAMLLAPKKSSLADFAPTGLHVGSALVALNQELADALFVQRIDRIGLATDAAKLAYFGQASSALDLIDTQLLFGDPATKLKLP